MQNALLKIATKQYLGRLVVVVGGGGFGQNALFKIAAKQCLELLMTLDFWHFDLALRTNEQTDGRMD